MDFQIIRDSFFFIGSVAGILAWIQPMFVARHHRDQQRALGIIRSLDEQRIVNLQVDISHRHIPVETFLAVQDVKHWYVTGQEKARFSGFLRDYYKEELRLFLDAYEKLRGYIEAPQWEVRYIDGEPSYWTLNKGAYIGQDGYPTGYSEDICEAEKWAREMRYRLQRFVVLAEIHFLESIIAKVSVERHFKRNGIFELSPS